MKEFKQDKKELELKISRLLDEFTNKYGVKVNDISLFIELDDDGKEIYLTKLNINL